MDDLLKDKFLSFEGDIPMSDWLAIEEKLNNKRRFAWIWWAALPLLIIAGLGFYSFFNTKQTKTLTKQTVQTIESNNEINNSKENKTVERIAEEKVAEEKISTQSENTYSTKKTNKNTSNSDYPVVKVEKTDENNQSSIIVYESIDVKSKSNGILWKFTLPILDKIKDIVQTSPPSKGKKPPLLSFEFGVNMAPAIGLDAIKENKSNWINRHYFSSIAGSSTLGSGFNNGIHAQMNIGNHWYIRQGVYSTTFSVYNNYDYIITELTFITVGRGIDGYIGLNSSDYQHIQHSGKASIKYLSLPFMIGNRFNVNKKIGVESKIGLNLSRLISAQGKTVNPTFLSLEDINSNNTIKKWNTGLTISTGLFYKPNNKFIFTAEPTFSTQLSSARNKDYPVKTRYYNYGFNLNVNYILGRK